MNDDTLEENAREDHLARLQCFSAGPAPREWRLLLVLFFSEPAAEAKMYRGLLRVMRRDGPVRPYEERVHSERGARVHGSKSGKVLPACPTQPFQDAEGTRHGHQETTA